MSSVLPPLVEEAAFEAFLRSRRLKMTSERRRVLRALLAREDHVDADTLQAALRAEGISRATVYRTLDLLVQGGFARRHTLGGHHACYEPVFGAEHHDHLVCVACAQVIEFFRPDLEALQETICAEHAFVPLQHTLQVFGLCAACKADFDPAQLPETRRRIHG